MFEIDHLMIEVDDPLKIGSNVAEHLGLPLAWPLTEKDEYTSIGVNFGDIFGLESISVKTYDNVLSAIAFLQGISTEELSEQGLDFFN